MMRKSRGLRYAVIGLAAYLGLLCLLVAFERAETDAQITDLPRALWYSLVTLTTVGYGDMTPVSPVGRLIGGVFLLMSTGLLAVLIGVIFAAVTGRLYPRLRLRRYRRAHWYVFSSDNAAARALASGLSDGPVIFCGKKARVEGNALWLEASPEALFQLPFAADGPRDLFLMDDDPSANERLALALMQAPAHIYCRSDGLNEDLPDNVTVFCDEDCAARRYWQLRPWRVEGERAALIGSGRFARALLMQGLLTAPPGCQIELFGNWALWQGLHGALSDVPDMTVTLRFHPEEWHDCPDALRDSDRMILCGDDQTENREILCLLRRYCVLHAEPDVLGPRGLQRARYFGDAEALFTPNLVMGHALSARARKLHELYRASVDYPVDEWGALSDFTKRSNLAAADHLLTKIRLLLPEKDVREITPEICRLAAERYDGADADMIERCRAIEHARWCLFHALYNWRYAARRDNARRLHPMMVPYDRLDETERRKDDNAWHLIGKLAEESDGI